LKKQLTDIEDKLNEEMEKMINVYEMKISHAITKINKLESSQIVIRNIIEDKKRYESPIYSEKRVVHSSTRNQTPTAEFNRPEILIKGSS
jgi:hypothetical protein